MDQDTFAHRLVLSETSHDPDRAAIPTWALAGASDFWVDRLSAAAALPPARRRLVRGSHTSIVKPPDKEADAYRRVREWIESCLARAATAARHPATAAEAAALGSPASPEAQADTVIRRPAVSSPPRIEITRLPAIGKTFVAREKELARLDAAWSGAETMSSASSPRAVRGNRR